MQCMRLARRAYRRLLVEALCPVKGVCMPERCPGLHMMPPACYHLRKYVHNQVVGLYV
jgi:hypothetical protein